MRWRKEGKVLGITTDISTQTGVDKRHSEQQPDQSLNRRDSPFVSTLGRVGVGLSVRVFSCCTVERGENRPGEKLERDTYTHLTPLSPSIRWL